MNTATRPRISVVMPSFNQARFIGEAVRSVMTQGIDDLELVVMDGGSTDGTLDRLASLAAEFPGHLRWFSGPDGGPSEAIHAAIVASRAPIIGWVNSDDLILPGGLARALAHFDAHPDHVMVYGEARHVDASGGDLGRYPTDPPSTPVGMFADGCFICQPSVVFRRDAYDAVGGIDRSLRASFDFDLWLKFFLAFPGRVGFIAADQAASRLHEETITSRQRERVAREGIVVLHRHLGSAPGHWLLTHLDELCGQHPFHPQPLDLPQHMAALVDELAPKMVSGAASEVMQRVRTDRRVALSTRHFAVGIHADGWAGEVLDLRLLQPEVPVAQVRLACRLVPPQSRLALRIVSPSGEVQTMDVVGKGPFELALSVPDRRPGSRVLWRILCDNPFVPALLKAGSGDGRALAFQVDGAELITG